MKARWSHCIDIENMLREIMLDGKHAEFIVKKYNSAPNKGSKDRKFLAEAVFTIVKNFRYYEYLANFCEEELKFKMIINVYFHLNSISPPQGNDWPLLDLNVFESKLSEVASYPSVVFSMPEWLDNIGEQMLPNSWQKIREVSVQQAPVFIRINNLRADIKKVRNHLEKEGISFEVINEVCLKLNQRINLNTDKAYDAGWFEIQDEGSQMIGAFANPAADQFIIDACAGAGGKSLHMAALMENEGNILSLDVNEKALVQLKIRAERAGATIISVSDYNDAEKLKSLNDSANLVLCDVPCSATGVMRREIDQKWKFTGEKLENLLLIQQEILQNASLWVKKGGYLVYATCSVLPTENEIQIDSFLKRNPNFALIGSKQLLPESNGHDGFYMCKMQKTM